MEPDLFSKYAYSEKVLTHADYDYIYISPHLDDVPLSCGGTIVQQKTQGLNILIVTVFAGDPEPPFSPFVQAFHRAWQAAEITPYRGGDHSLPDTESGGKKSYGYLSR